MTPSIALVLAITAGALVLFATERVPIAQVALSLPVVLMVSGLISPAQAVSGFSHEATVTVGCMLVLSLALSHTGVVTALATAAQRAAWMGPRARGAVLTVVAAAVSPFLNNTAVVVVLLPVFVALAERDGQPPSKALMPLSFAAILGGTVSLLGTSTNLVVAGLAHEHGIDDVRLFSMAPVGFPLAVAGLVYLLTLGRRLLPERAPRTDLGDRFGVRRYLTELEVEEGSGVVGCGLEELRWDELYGLEVLRARRGQVWVGQGAATLRPGDVLLVVGDPRDVLTVASAQRLQPAYGGWTPGAPLLEVMVAPGSPLVGVTLQQARFRQATGCVVVGIQHVQAVQPVALRDVPLRVGDLLLVRGDIEALVELSDARGLVPLRGLRASAPRRLQSVALLALAGVVVAAATGTSSILAAALVAAVAVVFAGCVTLGEVVEELDWNVIFLLAGTLPLGIAFETSGTAEWLAAQLASWLVGASLPAVVGLVYLVTCLLTNLISNNAAAIVVTPVALSTAAALGLPPQALLYTVMFGASAAFLTPMGYQTNAMVHGPGGYRFLDYARVGGPLQLLLFVLVVLGVPLMWG
jgi:di/tricarboxylate transporter